MWQDALRKSLVLPQNGQSNRTLLFRFHVGTWRDSSVFDFWEWFESPDDQRLYQRLGQDWRAWNLERGCYSPIQDLVEAKPVGADYLVSVTPCGLRNKIESSTKWDYLPPDDDPATYDPMAEDYDCITAAFEASLSSPRVLLDLISLPTDGCAQIADGIRAGTAGSVSDGSYDKDIQVGTSSLRWQQH